MGHNGQVYEPCLFQTIELPTALIDMAYTPCCKSVKIMGQRITQRILVCDLCGKTPDDGEYMWEMGQEVWCEECCKKQENESEEDAE